MQLVYYVERQGDPPAPTRGAARLSARGPVPPPAPGPSAAGACLPPDRN